MKIQYLIAIAIFWCVNLNVATAENINIGTLVLDSRNESSSLKITCDKIRNVMKCKFIQINIYKLYNPNSFNDRIARAKKFKQAKKELLSASKPMRDCKKYSLFLSQVESGNFPKKSRVSLEEISDTLPYMRAIVALCKKPTEANLKRLFDIENDRNSRTCGIWTNTFEEKFRHQTTGKWISNRGPSGQCGIIQVSELEPSKYGSPLWNYSTRRIVTNKKGGQWGICKKLGEDVRKYKWRLTIEQYKKCDYVKFVLN